MKKTIASLTALMLLGSPAPAVAKGKRDPAADAYEQARHDYFVLKADASRRKFRHQWLNVARKFEAVAKKYPSSDRAPDALYTAGELLSDLSRISMLDEDLQAALADYARIVEKYPKDNLADDAALAVARIYVDRTGETNKARTVVDHALASMPNGDARGKLVALEKTLPEKEAPRATGKKIEARTQVAREDKSDESKSDARTAGARADATRKTSGGEESKNDARTQLAREDSSSRRSTGTDESKSDARMAGARADTTRKTAGGEESKTDARTASAREETARKSSGDEAKSDARARGGREDSSARKSFTGNESRNESGGQLAREDSSARKSSTGNESRNESGGQLAREDSSARKSSAGNESRNESGGQLAREDSSAQNSSADDSKPARTMAEALARVNATAPADDHAGSAGPDRSHASASNDHGSGTSDASATSAAKSDRSSDSGSSRAGDHSDADDARSAAQTVAAVSADSDDASDDDGADAPADRSDDDPRTHRSNPADAKQTAARLKTAVKNTGEDEATIAQQLGLKVRRVVIDAGHGGHDTGAIGKKGSREKDVTLAIAKRVGEMLADQGLEVILTRDDDTFVRLEDRTRIANEAKGDLFISIHCNANENRKTRGIETYTLNVASDRYSIRLAARENASSEKSISDLQFILADLATKANTEESERLSKRIQHTLVGELKPSYAKVKDLGTKQALFYVLLGAKMPAVLVETSFISNPDEEQRLTSKGYQEDVAKAIADGVQAFLQDREKVARVD